MSEAAFSPRVLRCPRCEHSELVLAATAPEWLRRAGMLRSNSRLTPAEMAQLLPVAAAKLACPQCGAGGLAVEAWSDEDAAWPEARRCEACGGAIEAERLELMPNSRLCTACQRRAETPGGKVDGEFCPRCGWPMKLRATTAGLTRFRLACTNSRCK